MVLEKLIENLRRHEGYRPSEYLDTKRIPTIGYGHNLRNCPLTAEICAELLIDDPKILNEADALSLLDYDIALISKELFNSMPWLHQQPEDVVVALLDMAFNMGIPRLKGFKKMLYALYVEEDLEEAAKEALDSKWAREDVSEERSSFVAGLIRGGNAVD